MAGAPAHSPHGRCRRFYQGLSDTLTRYAQAWFELHRTLPDGSTQLSHLLAAKRAGQNPPELQLPPLPRAAKGVWQTFTELHADRGSGVSAPNSLTAAHLLSWQQLSRVRLSPWEVDAIRALDRVYFRHLAQQQSPGGRKKP